METLRFGNVTLDVSRGSLRDSAGVDVALRPKSLDLLLALARNVRRVLSRDELFDAVWPNVTVTEDSITQCVREVRRAIGDPEGRILRTVIGGMREPRIADIFSCSAAHLPAGLHDKPGTESGSYGAACSSP